MAAELELVSVNAADDGAVDATPGAVSTGYQNQNTIAQASYLGRDDSSAAIVGTNIVFYPSGIIDDSGLPFVIKSNVTIAKPTTGTNWFFKVVSDGASPPTRTIEATNDRGTYNTAKHGWYNSSGERVLNWCYNELCEEMRKIGVHNSDQKFGSYVECTGATANTISAANTPQAVRMPAETSDRLSEQIRSLISIFTAAENGVRTISATIQFLEDPSTISFFSLYIYKNGSAIARQSCPTIVGYDPYINVSANVNLDTGDTIEIYAESDNTLQFNAISLFISSPTDLM